MKRCLRVSPASLALLALLGVAWPAAASGPAAGAPAAAPGEDGACAEAVVQRVQTHYEGVRDLRARFTQTTQSIAFGGAPSGAEEQARGEVVFDKPGRMHWRYEKPEPSVVVSDGETLWIHDPAANEVQVLSVTGGFLSGAAIQFLLGEGRILESFRVAATGCGSGSVALRLEPREAATYERLELGVDPESGQIDETTVVDLFGNRTRIAFSGVKTNLDPPVEFFRFEPPEGARVLRMPPAP